MYFVTAVSVLLLAAAAGNASTISLATMCQANEGERATVTSNGSCSSWYAPGHAAAYAQAEGAVSFGLNNVRIFATQHAWYTEGLPSGVLGDVSAPGVGPAAFAATSVRLYGITDGPVRPGKLNYFFSGYGFSSPDASNPIQAWFDSAVLDIGATPATGFGWSVDTTLGQRFDITAYSALSTRSGVPQSITRLTTELEVQFFESDGRTPVRIAEVAPVPEPSTLLLGSLSLIFTAVLRRRRSRVPR